MALNVTPITATKSAVSDIVRLIQCKDVHLNLMHARKTAHMVFGISRCLVKPFFLSNLAGQNFLCHNVGNGISETVCLLSALADFELTYVLVLRLVALNYEYYRSRSNAITYCGDLGHKITTVTKPIIRGYVPNMVVSAVQI